MRGAIGVFVPRFSEGLGWVNPKDRCKLAGMEIFEITPVVLGGSPTDPANKAVINRQQHIEAVRYWNKVIRDLRSRERPAAPS